jgi:hypothetical protein
MTADQDTPNDRTNTTAADALAEMETLTGADPVLDVAAKRWLAEMEGLTRRNAAATLSEQAAADDALAQMEALSDGPPVQRTRPSSTDEAPRNPLLQDSARANRAIYQATIEMIDAFRPKSKPRRRNRGYER